MGRKDSKLVTTTIRKYVWNLAFPKVPWASGKPAQLKRSLPPSLSPLEMCVFYYIRLCHAESQPTALYLLRSILCYVLRIQTKRQRCTKVPDSLLFLLNSLLLAEDGALDIFTGDGLEIQISSSDAHRHLI